MSLDSSQKALVPTGVLRDAFQMWPAKHDFNFTVEEWHEEKPIAVHAGADSITVARLAYEAEARTAAKGRGPLPEDAGYQTKRSGQILDFRLGGHVRPMRRLKHRLDVGSRDPPAFKPFPGLPAGLLGAVEEKGPLKFSGRRDGMGSYCGLSAGGSDRQRHSACRNGKHVPPLHGITSPYQGEHSRDKPTAQASDRQLEPSRALGVVLALVRRPRV